MSLRICNGRPYSRNAGESLLDPYVFCSSEAVASQQIPRPPIGERQGIAEPTIPRLELPLEVGAPDIVGGGGGYVRSARVPRPAPPAPGLDQAVPLEDVRDRRLGGKSQPWMQLRKTLPQGHCPPGHPLAPQGHDELFDCLRRLVRAALGSARLLLQSLLLLPSAKPLVTRRAADPVPLAQFRHAPKTRCLLAHESSSLTHRICLLPRHRHLLEGANPAEVAV